MVACPPRLSAAVPGTSCAVPQTGLPGEAAAAPVLAAALPLARNATPAAAAAAIIRTRLSINPTPLLPPGPAIQPRLLRQPRQPKLRGAGQSRSAALPGERREVTHPKSWQLARLDRSARAAVPVSPAGADPWRAGAVSRLGEADRARRDRSERPNLPAPPRLARHHRDTS